MLDRASTFADPEIVNLLQTRFIPVAIDQAYQRRQQDTEGDFYRKIAGQGPRNNFEGTTQGFYMASAAGELLLYNNNRDPAKVRRWMHQKLADFVSSSPAGSKVAELEADKVDLRYSVNPPEGGLVVRVRAKVLGGYEPASNKWRHIFQTSLSRDNLWISKQEHEALVGGTVPASLCERIARFHLVDNTRGEPPMWKHDEIRQLDVRLQHGRLSGSVHLETKDGTRGYKAELLGTMETKNSRITRFDVVALGQFWGEGSYTRGAPEGEFPLAVGFALADGTDAADRIPPQASRGWLQGYLP